MKDDSRTATVRMRSAPVLVPMPAERPYTYAVPDGMDVAVRLRQAGLEPGRIARLTVLVGEVTGLVPEDGDLGEGDLVARLGTNEKQMLPDVEGTLEALYQRIVELGRALHRLDLEIGAEKLPELDERIAQGEKSGASADADRRTRLLMRQREMLASLLESRDRLAEQYESAGLLLQNLKLDLIRMRSSGLQAGIAGVTSVTQEARALSKEIGYVLAAADELRDIS